MFRQGALALVVGLFTLLLLGLASGASAGVFEAAQYPVTITGEKLNGSITGKTIERHEITTNAGTLKCKKAAFHGVLTAQSSQLLLSGGYSECTTAGIGATINMNGCEYLFTAGTTTGSEVDVETHLQCPAGKVVEITALGTTCKKKIPAQTLSGVIGEDVVGGFLLDIDITGMKYEIENGAGTGCPNSPKDGAYTDGSYKGLIALAGEVFDPNSAVEVNIT